METTFSVNFSSRGTALCCLETSCYSERSLCPTWKFAILDGEVLDILRLNFGNFSHLGKLQAGLLVALSWL